MTLMQKSFGSKCSLSPKFCTDAVKNSGIIDAVLSFAKFKAQAALQRKCDGKKVGIFTPFYFHFVKIKRKKDFFEIVY